MDSTPLNEHQDKQNEQYVNDAVESEQPDQTVIIEETDEMTNMSEDDIDYLKYVLTKIEKNKIPQDSQQHLVVKLIRSATAIHERTQQMNALLTELGVESPENASHMLESLREQVEVLYHDKKQLQELGVSEVGDAVTMVRSMEEQLQTLYKEKEIAYQAMQDIQEGDVYEKLQSLYAERELLQRELNIESIEAIPDLVQSMRMQLEAMYKEKEELQNQVRFSSAEELVSNIRGMEQQLQDLYHDRKELANLGIETPDKAFEMIHSMEEQLKELYAEKEVLTGAGWESPKAILQVSRQQKMQLSKLRKNHEQLKTELKEIRESRELLQSKCDVLQEHFGVADPILVIELVNNMRLQLEDFYKEKDEVEADKRISVDGAPSIMQLNTLKHIETLSTKEREAFSIGIMELSDEGNVLAVNGYCNVLPGLVSTDSALGKNFFQHIAPATNNRLFYGRFISGVHEGKMDVRFRYTLVQPKNNAINLIVHLHRKHDHGQNWLFFRQT